MPENAKFFPMLKSIEKLQQQEEIFRKIVKHLAKSDTSGDYDIKWGRYFEVQTFKF